MKNPKLLTLGGAFVALLSLFFTACEQDNDLPAPSYQSPEAAQSLAKLVDSVIFEYFYDGRQVSEAQFSAMVDSIEFILKPYASPGSR